MERSYCSIAACLVLVSLGIGWLAGESPERLGANWLSLLAAIFSLGSYMAILHVGGRNERRERLLEKPVTIKLCCRSGRTMELWLHPSRREVLTAQGLLLVLCSLSGRAHPGLACEVVRVVGSKAFRGFVRGDYDIVELYVDNLEEFRRHDASFKAYAKEMMRYEEQRWQEEYGPSARVSAI